MKYYLIFLIALFACSSQNKTETNPIKASYKIMTLSGSNGTISESLETSGRGYYTIEMTPDVGYLIDYFTIDGVDYLIEDGVSNPLASSYTFADVNSDHTIAVFFKEGFTIETKSGLHGSISASPTVKPNGEVTIEITPELYFDIEELNVDGIKVESNLSYSFTNVTSNHSIEVTFKRKTVKVFVDRVENGTIDLQLKTSYDNITLMPEADGSYQANYLSSYVLRITPDYGFNIDKIIVDGVLIPYTDLLFSASYRNYSLNYSFPSIETDHSVSVTFKRSFSIYFNKNDANYNNKIFFVDSGADFTYVIPLEEGFELNSLFVDDILVTNTLSYTFSNVDANHQISAFIKPRTFLITTSSDINGSILNANTMVDYGEDATIRISPLNGYDVDTILVDGINMAPSKTIYPKPYQWVQDYIFKNVTSDHTIAVTFALAYSIYSNNGENGRISGSQLVRPGSDATFTFTPDLGYQVSSITIINFLGIPGDFNNFETIEVPAALSYTFKNVTSAHQIAVSFKPITYKITTASGIHGTISESVEVARGDSVEIEIIPEKGYGVEVLKIDGFEIDWPTNYTFLNVSTNHTIEVSFALSKTINTSVGANGQILPSGNVEIAIGTNQSFEILPNAGYQIDELKIDGIKVDSEVEYTFKNITSSHSIYATFKPLNVLTIGNRYLPIKKPLKNIKSIVAGEKFSFALKSDSTVVGWGRNDDGVATVPLGLIGVISIASFFDHTIALLGNGTVVAWGFETFENIVPGDLMDLKMIATGASFNVGLKKDGTVVEWYGGYYHSTVPADLNNVIKIAAGSSHALALKSDGSVVAWGENYATQIEVPSNLKDVVSIAAGWHHSLALKSDGTVVGWGSNYEGETTIPDGLMDVVFIAAGTGCSAALKSDGTVVTWGKIYNKDTSALEVVAVPEGLTGVTEISIGYNHILALKSDGTIVGWGSYNAGLPSVPVGLSGVVKVETNGESNLLVGLKKDGTVVSWNSIGEILEIPPFLTGVTAVFVYNQDAIALKSDGTIVGWGKNEYGRLNFPSGLSGVIDIAIGDSRSLALKSDGSIVEWGIIYENNFSSDLFFFSAYSKPVNLTGVVDVALSVSQAMALNKDGTIEQWGRVYEGSTYSQPELKGIKSITSGYDFFVGINSDSTVTVWNDSTYSDEEDGFTPPKGLSGVINVAVGSNYIVALKSDGTVVPWGYSFYGELDIPQNLPPIKSISAGNGTTTFVFKEE